MYSLVILKLFRCTNNTLSSFLTSLPLSFIQSVVTHCVGDPAGYFRSESQQSRNQLFSFFLAKFYLVWQTPDIVLYIDILCILPIAAFFFHFQNIINTPQLTMFITIITPWDNKKFQDRIFRKYLKLLSDMCMAIILYIPVFHFHVNVTSLIESICNRNYTY